MTNDVPRSLGALGEQAAARRYDLEPVDGTTGFFDARYRSNGRKVQVKSASKDGGVLRVWREHLEALAEHAGSVIVVVVDRPADAIVTTAKVSPSTLLDVGDYRLTGQEAMSGMHEARIPWPEVVSA